MVYIFSLTVLLFIGGVHMLKALQAVLAGQTTRSLVPYIFIYHAIGLCAAAPFLIEMWRQAQMHGQGLPLSDSNQLGLWLSGTAGVAAVLLYGAQLYRARHLNMSFGQVGLRAAGVLAGFYLIFAVVDDLVFFHNSKNAGVLNWAFFQTVAKVDDVHCDSTLILVQDFEAQSVLYRCPHNIILGIYTSRPWVPWPSYSEGSSIQLGGAMKTWMASMKKE